MENLQNIKRFKGRSKVIMSQNLSGLVTVKDSGQKPKLDSKLVKSSPNDVVLKYVWKHVPGRIWYSI